VEDNRDKPLDTDEKAFNETLKRMLKTPPKPHEKAVKDKPNQPVKSANKGL